MSDSEALQDTLAMLILSEVYSTPVMFCFTPHFCSLTHTHMWITSLTNLSQHTHTHTHTHTLFANCSKQTPDGWSVSGQEACQNGCAFVCMCDPRMDPCPLKSSGWMKGLAVVLLVQLFFQTMMHKMMMLMMIHTLTK